MARVATFRYPRRTRTRALEIAHRDGCSTRDIIEALQTEGHGDVTRNTVERWLREDPARRATQAAALGQRLRHEAALCNGGQDHADRIRLSAEQLADVLTITAKRASEALPRIKIRSISDLARITSAMADISNASIEGFRAALALQEHRETTKHT